jgi:Ser/Thr protein kinase RdoA (MazF antagonist)
MLELITNFCLHGNPLSCEKYGNGHINSTYFIITDCKCEYILQRINRFVFKDPEALMKNFAAVTNHLRQSAGDPRSVLVLIPTTGGDLYHLDNNGEYWRMFNNIPGTISLDRAETPADFRESGAAFGRFQQALSNFNAYTLHETIPRFHDTPHRYSLFKEAMAENPHNRLKDVVTEVDFAMARESYAQTLNHLQKEGVLPLRVTHNDTKLNNVLFDKKTRKALCVIDLDTVMPGLAAYDFGDSIRYGASTAAEDERDLNKVSMSLELFEAYAQGYLSNCDLTKAERSYLRDGVRTITLECGLRFLTDHLNGDIYFNTSRPNHNLDRCRTQFKLVEDIEHKWDEMGKILECC